MPKRIGLFLATNVLTVLGLSLLLRVLGWDDWLAAKGLDPLRLALFCLLWGFGGAFLSLGLSRIVARRALGVQIVDPEAPGPFAPLVETAHALSAQAGLAVMPQVGIYPGEEINAFATGPTRNRSLVAVSTGLLDRLDEEQVKGVIAHEVAHIANGDMVTMTLLQGVMNAFALFFARVLGHLAASAVHEEQRPALRTAVTLGAELALGLAGGLVTAWFSRRREYRADRDGARLAGPVAMIGALMALKRNFRLRDPEEGSRPALDAMKIFRRQSTLRLMTLFATHPPLSARLAALQSEWSGELRRRRRIGEPFPYSRAA